MKEIKRSDLSLEYVARQWLYFNRNSFKNSTLQTYKYHLEKHIVSSELARCQLDAITPEEIVQFTQELLDTNLSPKTINSILLEINSIFKFAKALYDYKPPYIKYIKEKRREMRVLSVAEQNRLEQFLRENMDNYNLGMLFALYTGVRIGELCALKWSDIRDGAVKVNKTMHRLRDENGRSVITLDEPKTPSSNRTIPLPDFLVQIIEEKRKPDKDFFLSTEKIQRVEPRLMQKKFASVALECQLDGATFHTLRHTFATRCIECGFDPKTLSEILGHADVKTTLNRYVHSSFELKKNSMNLLTKIAV